ncbi:MAG TPA: DUF1015 domain-containing protein [Crocinitomicaceae bacterium]|nr:DUF1015 domain-containing protein [Crocinitomicaceae bacterium]
MTKISSFKAIRPTRDKVHFVAAKPFYAYDKNVLEAILQANPYSFLHIINPEFGPVPTQPNSEERFKLIHDAYEKFKEDGIFIQDTEASIYLYRQTKNNHEYLGIIAGASIDEYNNNQIKVHEATLTSREEMFTNYLDLVGYNAEPVLLSYSDKDHSIDAILDHKVLERPEYEFSTMDTIKHELWILSKDEEQAIKESFEKLDAVYIADGHHRIASSAGLKRKRNQLGLQRNGNEDNFLAFFINENRLEILEFNRLVKTLNNHSIEDIIELLSENFDVQKLDKAKKPMKHNEFSMCIDNNWYSVICKEKIIHQEHPVKSLDAEILTQYILDPIFGIKDLKNDTNIDFISGDHPVEEFSNKMQKRGFKIGFVLYPINIEEIKRVADNNMVMPPKSTWIEPKLRSGLTIYNLNE